MVDVFLEAELFSISSAFVKTCRQGINQLNTELLHFSSYCLYYQAAVGKKKKKEFICLKVRQQEKAKGCLHQNMFTLLHTVLFFFPQK